MTTTLAPQRTIPTARLVACYAAILGTFPYLTLKISWLTGGTIGLRDSSFLDSPIVLGVNLLTAGMDAVAILLAFALTYAWGRRIPTPIVLFPAWLASGLLTPIVLTSPAIAADLVSPRGSTPLEDWVWAVVYGGLTWQGIALLTAFAFSARDRWPHLPNAELRPGPLSPVGLVAVAAAIGTALVQLAWAFGSTIALDPGRPLDAGHGRRRRCCRPARRGGAAVGGTAVAAPGRGVDRHRAAGRDLRGGGTERVLLMAALLRRIPRKA